MKKVEEKYIKRERDIKAGDTVKVHVRIKEGGKERIQVFEGVVIAVKGTGSGKTFTVRKISHGVGVEKIFPFNSPLIKKIDVVERGKMRRSKLYYMRKKIGKRSLDVNLVDEFEAIIEEEEAEEAEEKGEKGEKAEVKEEAPAKEEAPKEEAKEKNKEEKPAKGEKKEEKAEEKPKKAEKPEAKPEEKKEEPKKEKPKEKAPKEKKE